MSRDNVTSEDFDRLTMSLTKNSVASDELINILVSTNLSRIMLSGDERMLTRSGESVVLRQLVAFVPSLIILDLLCAYDISYEASRDLLKSATQKLCLHKSTGKFVCLLLYSVCLFVCLFVVCCLLFVANCLLVLLVLLVVLYLYQINN